MEANANFGKIVLAVGEPSALSLPLPSQAQIRYWGRTLARMVTVGTRLAKRRRRNTAP